MVWAAGASRLDRLGRTDSVAEAWVRSDADEPFDRLGALSPGVASRFVPAVLAACCGLEGPLAGRRAAANVARRLETCGVVKALWTGAVAVGASKLPRRAAALVALVARGLDAQDVFLATLKAAGRAFCDAKFLREADDDRRAFNATLLLSGVASTTARDEGDSTSLQPECSGRPRPRNKNSLFKNAPRDDPSSKHEPNRVEHDRERSF